MESRAYSTVTILTDIFGANNAVAPMIVPPDGGWGWVIVFTGFFSCAVTDGIAFCFYLFKKPMAEDLGIDQAEIAFLSALYTGFYFIGGIVACSVGNYWGFRLVLFVGGVVSGLAFGSGYILEEMFYFLVIVGFVGGMAGGFIFVAGLLPAGFYFDKKRAIALGLVSSGSGVGAIFMPQIATVFMDIYGWRLTYACFGGLFMAMGLMGFLVRPLEPVMVVIRAGSGTSMATRTGGPLSSIADLSLFRIPNVDRASMATSYLGRVTPTTHPTISQMAQDYDMISIRVGDGCEQGTMLRLQEIMQPRLLQPSASVVVPTISVDEEPVPMRSRPWYKCGCCRERERAVPERPLLRTDLYYTGSLTRLEEYTTKDKDVEYHMHVTKVPTYFETMQDMTRSYTYWCCWNIMTGIKSLLDYTLLESLTFLNLALCGYGTYAGYFLPFLYAKTFLEVTGNDEYATMLVSVTGLGSMMGRLFSGILVVKVPRFGARTTAGFANIIAGLAAIAATLHHNLAFQLGCVFVYGFTAGFFAPLRSIIIVDFMGLETLTSATGMMIMFQGCGSFTGAPLAELALEYTQDKRSPYLVCGGLMIFAGIVLWPMRRCQRWDKRRKEKKDQRTATSLK